jgi:hypothetical protein
MKPGWKWVAAMSVLVLGIVVSVSGAATSGSTRDGGAERSQRSEGRMHAPGPPGEHLATLAGELDVSQEKLRDALEAVREDLAPPQRPRRGQRPSKAQMEKRCNEFTDALAKELDKSGDDVRDAIKSAAKKGVDEAVDDGRLTRSQANRILERLDDAACLPAFGLHGRGGPGCGGPGGHGPGGPGGGRFERHMGPPGESGSGGDSSTGIPAPMGAPA